MFDTGKARQAAGCEVGAKKAARCGLLPVVNTRANARSTTFRIYADGFFGGRYCLEEFSLNTDSAAESASELG